MVAPGAGAYVVDTRDGRVGRVVGREGRASGCGRSGRAGVGVRPEATRCATAGERLRAETRYANARSRGERA
ncbi:hypothetical protein O1L44_23415 [Streptomyces noursei]|nr:hypothetical protein [Streptomyces noursei]